MQPGYSLGTFTGHSTPVMLVDFHPNKDDLICSCDGDGDIMQFFILFYFILYQIKCYMQQLLTGLQHCHEMGIMH